VSIHNANIILAVGILNYYTVTTIIAIIVLTLHIYTWGLTLTP
jgi:hypothetical protein